MGVDLTLYPLDMFADSELPGRASHFPFTKLATARDYELQGALQAETPRPLDSKMALYEDEGMEYVTEDAYGQALTWLPARAIVKVLENLVRIDRVNRSVLGYLREADPRSMVILYWH